MTTEGGQIKWESLEVLMQSISMQVIFCLKLILFWNFHVNVYSLYQLMPKLEIDEQQIRDTLVTWSCQSW